MLTHLKTNSLLNFLAACLLAGLLAACGGGGSNDGCVNVDPTRPSALPGCGGGTSTSPGTGGSTTSSVVLTMVDASGAALSNLMPDKPGILKAVVKNANGVLVADAVVAFTTTDQTGVFSPSAGTALSDKDGVATVKLAAGTLAGAFTASASTVIGTTAVKATKSYTVSFPVLTMSDLQITPATMTAGGNASVSLSIMNGTAPYTQPISVAFSSACVAAGKATIGTPVITQNGIATASYTDKGCSNSDTITATATAPSATLTKSGNITIQPNIVGSLMFSGITTSSIALRGTGGLGRPEFATVQFKIFDRSGNPVVGKAVSFAFSDSGTSTTTGDLKLYPVSGTSSADGSVTTTVSGGTIPTSVRVTASTSGDLPLMTAISSEMVVSSGVPDQAHLSFGVTVGNCEGWSYNMQCNIAEVIVGDHFGNQVPDGTAVSFTAEGGVIEDSCKTLRGRCQVKFYSANPRPTGGKVTLMAYLIGEESFTDSNGNNVYDNTEPYMELKPDIFRDDDENGQWSPGEPCISIKPSPGCNAAGDGQYNGVLRIPQVPTPQALYISRSLVTQFSTSDAIITVVNPTLTCSAGATIEILVKVTDMHGLWMPAETKINIDAAFSQKPLSPPEIKPALILVPNVVLAVGDPVLVPTYPISFTCPSPDSDGTLIITVTSPAGTTTVLKKPIL